MIYYSGPLVGSATTERTFDILCKKAAEESAEYLNKFIDTAIFCEHGWWNIALSKMNTEGLHIEFGVGEGESLKYFSNFNKKITWYGFDSFFGLQEDWKGGPFSKGHFNLNGKVPKFEKNVIINKGWFKDTLPKFLKKNKENFSFIHIDCDTYESTKNIFDCIDKKRLQKGCIIIFDEYFGYIGWKKNEFKAWQEYVNTNQIKYKYIAFAEKQAVIEIL